MEAATTPSRDARSAPTDLRLLEAWRAIESPSTTVFSTDVFDTLVWRTVPEPVDAFPLVAVRLRERGQLAASLTPEAFGHLRRLAERTARADRAKLGQGTEVSLEEIYQRMPPWVFDAAIASDAAAAVEVEVEGEIIVPDLDIVDLLDTAQQAGKRIVAISDTYFSSAQLRELISQPVLSRLTFDAIFTSSDHRTNKSGGLYEIVLRTLGIDGSEMLHVGDNPEADSHYPRLQDVRTVFFDRRPEPFASVDDKEARFRPVHPEDLRHQAVVSGLTAARSKVLFRTELASLPASMHPHWKYGATVLGPIFTGFADWVVDECDRRNTELAGCLMREGEFLADLIGRAARYRGSPLEAKPLWLNRAVLLRAAIAKADREELAPFAAGRTPMTVGAFLDRLGLGMAALPGWASHADTTLDDPVVVKNLMDEIEGDDRLRAEIVANARTVRERVLSLVQGFAGDGDTPLTVVDLGWGATIQRLLADVLAEGRAERHTVGFYLLTHEAAAEQIARTGIEAYGFLGELGAPEVDVKLIMRSPELLEQVCMPEAGSQLDLDADLQPVCAPNDIPRLQGIEAAAVRQGIFAFQREWGRYHAALPGRLPRLGGMREVLRPMLVRSVVAPTAEEAAVFGAWHHDENRGTDRIDLVIDPADAERIRHMDPDQARRLPMTELYWPYGLLAQVDEAGADLMTAAAAGQVPWEALAAPLDTGRFVVRPEGVGVDPGAVVEARPTRNRLGLSAVNATVRASHIASLSLRPTETPGVVRFDRVRLRCWRQGEAEPLTLLLESPEDFERFEAPNGFALHPNVIVSHSGSAELRLDLATVTPRIVYRVDVEVLFAALAISQVLPGEGRYSNLEEAAEKVARAQQDLIETQERTTAEIIAAHEEIKYMRGTSSWRFTKPLRSVKRLLRR